MAHSESWGRTDGEAGGTTGTLADAPDVLTVQEVRKILRIGRNQAYALIASGRVRSCRIGGAIRVPRSALEQFVEGSVVAGDG
jgi:excisionase family DNA binding protein